MFRALRNLLVSFFQIAILALIIYEVLIYLERQRQVAPRLALRRPPEPQPLRSAPPAMPAVAPAAPSQARAKSVPVAPLAGDIPGAEVKPVPRRRTSRKAAASTPAETQPPAASPARRSRKKPEADAKSEATPKRRTRKTDKPTDAAQAPKPRKRPSTRKKPTS